MIDLNLINRLLFGSRPSFSNIAVGQFDDLPPGGLTLGTLYAGRQGTGKTSALARHIVEYFKTYPGRGIFVLDWSGSISDNILHLILQEPLEVREKLLQRLVFDDMGNPDLVIPLPEFSLLYGGTYEEQVQRVAQNLEKLAPELVQGAPFLAGLGLQEIAPELFRLLTAIRDEQDKTWQITETKRLIVDKPLLRHAVAKFGHKVPEAKWFLEKLYLNLRNQERELRSYAVLALLGSIEPRETRARVGYFQPGWTPQEAIEKGLMVLVTGARLINQRMTQHYLFTQVYSLIMAEINKRQPGNPNDRPVALVMDEVYSLLSIPGMAKEIGMLSPLYRSRKLQLYIVLQALSQLSPTLRDQIWSLGNIVCFAISNFDEAYELAQQLFPYAPNTIKVPARSERGQPIMEPDRGQYLAIANWIQRLKHRECVIRRYVSEKDMDRYVYYVPKTKENPANDIGETITEVKESLIRERGVRVRDALEIINQRKIVSKSASTRKKTPPQI